MHECALTEKNINYTLRNIKNIVMRMGGILKKTSLKPEIYTENDIKPWCVFYYNSIILYDWICKYVLIWKQLWYILYDFSMTKCVNMF